MNVLLGKGRFCCEASLLGVAGEATVEGLKGKKHLKIHLVCHLMAHVKLVSHLSIRPGWLSGIKIFNSNTISGRKQKPLSFFNT